MRAFGVALAVLCLASAASAKPPQPYQLVCLRPVSAQEPDVVGKDGKPVRPAALWVNLTVTEPKLKDGWLEALPSNAKQPLYVSGNCLALPQAEPVAPPATGPTP